MVRPVALPLDHLLTALEHLCTGCARCCNGSMFPATQLEPAEQRRFGCGELPQPCPQLGADRRCTVYATRPAACAKYLCPTAVALERGELGLVEASARVSGSGSL